ncbi:MAG: hypothetical protein QXK24_00790 [Ignisphaera sp.]|uniref:Uncharacterized protein n=1 Tax=Ignisphaera aggregans TaxID=334771 RepID=A0A7C4H682_9CREN
MELHIDGFANMIKASYNLLPDDASVVVVNKSATGKTTIAKILYAYLTSEIKSDLISKGYDSGSSELIFRNKTYKIQLSRSGEAQIDRVFNKDYGQYLVLTEAGPMHVFYYQPDKFDLSVIVDKVIEKPNTKDIDEEIRKIEQSMGSFIGIIKEYEELIPRHEFELSEIEKKLMEIEKKIEKSSELEKIKLILRKKELENEIQSINEQIKRYEDEITAISNELQGIDYNELRKKRKSLGETIEKLEKLRLTYNGIIENLKDLREVLRRLIGFADTLNDLNIYLFGSLVEPQTIESFMNDCDIALEEVMTKSSELDIKINEIRQELNSIDNSIRYFNEKFSRRETLQLEIQKLIDKKKNKEYEKMRLERDISRLVKELGKSEDELVNEYISQEDVQTLLSEKNKLMNRKQELITTLSSLRNMIEKFRKEQVLAEELRKKYEELKRIKEEKETEYQRKRRQFIETFKSYMNEAYNIISKNGIKIEHFNPQTLKFERSGQTYSKSERLLITACYITSLARTLIETGHDVPFIVIDVLSPIDTRFEKALMNLVKTVSTKTIILMTKNENTVYPIQ